MKSYTKYIIQLLTPILVSFSLLNKKCNNEITSDKGLFSLLKRVTYGDKIKISYLLLCIFAMLRLIE